MGVWNVCRRKKVQRMERRARRMEQDEIKEEIKDFGSHAKDLASILRSIRGQRKHFNKGVAVEGWGKT